MRKKWHKLIWLLLIFIVFTSLSSAKRKMWTILEPISARKISVSVSGKDSEYFVLEKNKSLEIKVEGPTTIKVISRLNFAKGASGSARYSLEIKEKNQIIKSYSTTSEPSDAIYRSYDGAPGKSRKFSFDVPEGNHTYSIRLVDSQGEILLKFLTQSAGIKSSWVSIAPLEYDKAVTAILKEKPLSYYLCTAEKPVKVKIIGPTKLRIVTRLNYESNMKGKQKYQLLVEEKGETIQKQPLETTKSLTVIYHDLKTVVPGQSKTFFIDIPPGQHSYTFRPGETIAKSVSLRFSIPEKDLKNEG